jgi:hypothetical protein
MENCDNRLASADQRQASNCACKLGNTPRTLPQSHKLRTLFAWIVSPHKFAEACDRICQFPTGALCGRSGSRRLPREGRLQRQADTRRQNQLSAHSWRRKVRRGFPDQGSLFRFASADKPPQTKRPRVRRKRRIEDSEGYHRAEQRGNGNELHAVLRW